MIFINEKTARALQCSDVAAIHSEELPNAPCFGETFGVLFPDGMDGGVRGCTVRVIGFQQIEGKPYHIAVPTCLGFKLTA